jgi:hypothetical protein
VIASLLGMALQVSITVIAPETLTVRQPAMIVVRASSAGRDVPVIKAPSLAPLTGIRTEESRQVTGDGYSRSVAIEHRYLVVASRPGQIEIGPFEARGGGMIRRSAPLTFTVLATPVVTVPAIIARAHVDSESGVGFHALATPDTVYVGEQATYEVGVFLNDDVRYRLRRNPEFIPPELRSMLAYDVVAPGATVLHRQLGGRDYEVHVFQRALFPLSAGHYVIPPARLNYSLPLSASFFSREESHQASSESVTVVVRDPPAGGRPPDFRGAVGRFSLDARMDSRSGRVGDPLLLTVRVSGAGNVHFFPRPELKVPWGEAVAAAERVEMDSSTVTVRGTKEFDWVITPAHDGDVEVPAIKYPYFNPLTEHYELAVTSPQRLTIAPGTLAGADSSALPAAALLALRPRLTTADQRSLLERRGFWAAVLLAPVPALLVGVARRPRRRRVVTPDRRLRALARSAAPTEPATLRRAYTTAISSRVAAVEAETLTDRQALVRALRHSGVTSAVAREVDALLAELDAAVFSRGESLGADAARRAWELFRKVDAEARTRAPIPSAVLGVVAVFVIAGAAAALSDPAADEAFTRGIRAYEAHQFAAAERLFADAARREPLSSDAWANFGTAGWAAHDTAAAAVGWQRALRIDPLAADVRDHLELTPGFQSGSIADVTPVPATWAALLAGALWLAAWALGAVAAWRRDRLIGRTGGAIAVLAMVAGVAGYRALESQRGERLAVITDGTLLRSLPALGGESGAPVLTGEVVETVGAQGVWTHVRLSDDRDGWIESARVQSIAQGS